MTTKEKILEVLSDVYKHCGEVNLTRKDIELIFLSTISKETIEEYLAETKSESELLKKAFNMEL
jgi:hypothetical protein